MPRSASPTPRRLPPEPRPDGPVRTCIGCRTRLPAAQLVRIVRVTHPSDGTVSLAVASASAGRGAWLCRAPDGAARVVCATQAQRRHAFDRALRVKLAPAEVARLVAESASQTSAEEALRTHLGPALRGVSSPRDAT